MQEYEEETLFITRELEWKLIEMLKNNRKMDGSNLIDYLEYQLNAIYLLKNKVVLDTACLIQRAR